MGLDVYLTLPDQPAQTNRGEQIFIRRNGSTVEISRAEWDELYPNQVPVTVQTSDDETNEVYSANITHNLTKMADAAGIYQALWRPEEIGVTKAVQLIKLLTDGYLRLIADPTKYQAYNAPNGWGMYDDFVPFVRNYLTACIAYPNATVNISR